MIPLIVEQAVDHKLSHRISILVGNFEFYYAAGLASKRLGLTCDGTEKPEDLSKAVRDALPDHADDIDRKDATEDQYLLYLLERYEIEPDFAPEMTELFQKGRDKAAS